ncbi:MAG: ThiF family adenylyltransferase [Chitinophagaceae bacterium]|nr:ThiF family adenylyltransferase [Chitinophagaceae bacterium]
MKDKFIFSQENNTNVGYTPLIFRIRNSQDYDSLRVVLENAQLQIFDTIQNQLSELIRIKNPGKMFSSEEMKEAIDQHLGATEPDKYGVWVYYPWLQKLIHLVDEEEFITIRTNRNAYKISPEEQKNLREKKIGIIGLSVGQAIAITMATERICGEMRLADFDTIELSNLNRLSVGVQELGNPKVVVAARRIAEIDPFIKVKCYTDGITEQNIDDFLTKEGKVDVLVEECDNIVVKILSRFKARAYEIPVVMDTNDKGMLDIERFDNEPARGILHNKLPEFEKLGQEELINKLKNLTIQEKFALLTNIIGFENVSDEMKFSLSQLNQTIIGWPQIASAVHLGGAMVTDVCRKIILGKKVDSGRYFIDFNELIN